MAVIKAVSSRASVGTLVNYVTQAEKTEEKLISGQDCSPQTAIDEMKATKEIWRKQGGRDYYHFVQSFSPEETITPQEAHTMAKELAEQRFKGYEVVIATHKDRDHIHTHFVVNSVNHEDGYKLNWSKFELQRMKDMSDSICREYGKSICQKQQDIATYKMGKYKALEQSITGNYKSYVLDCYKTVSTVKEKATSQTDFIAKMQEQGYQTKWTDSRKHITFTDQDGNKVRNTNLEKTFKEPFGKEELGHGFERNLEAEHIRSRAAEQSRGLEADTGLDRPLRKIQAKDTDLAMDKLNATIGKSNDEISRDDSQRADRIAHEQSSQRERNGIKEQRALEKRQRSQGLER